MEHYYGVPLLHVGWPERRKLPVLPVPCCPSCLWAAVMPCCPSHAVLPVGSGAAILPVPAAPRGHRCPSLLCGLLCGCWGTGAQAELEGLRGARCGSRGSSTLLLPLASPEPPLSRPCPSQWGVLVPLPACLSALVSSQELSACETSWVFSFSEQQFLFQKT